MRAVELPAAMSERTRAAVRREIDEHDLQLAEVVDYLLVASHPIDDRVPAGREGPVEMGAGVTLESIDRELADRLFDAAGLRGENWSGGYRQFYAIQAYVRHVWRQGDDVNFGLYTWDHDARIWPTVQLARLVRDNATSTEYAVRRLIHRGGTERLVPFAGFDSHTVYRLYPGRSGWLDVAEAAEIRALMDAWWAEPVLPSRAARALRRVASVTDRRYLEDALPVVVGGFEALLKIGRDYAKQQFAQRVPQLAADVGIELSREECASVYDDRSALVHGSVVDLSVPHELDEFERLFQLLQEALRRTVRRTIDDRPFAESFEDDASITERWPVTVPTRGDQMRII
jgi:hypothetical protein